jgi:hypothetical protein
MYSRKFALDFDDDEDQYCMGYDTLENGAPVVASKCYEGRDPYDAKIYWKML